MNYTKGIDVSHYNKIDNYDQARGAIDWVYMKATEGSSMIDNYFWDGKAPGDHYRGFGGKPRGAYHFTDLGNVITEVAHFVDYWHRCPTELDPMLDAECAGINSSYIKSWVAEFRRVTNHRRIWVYSSWSLFRGKCNPDDFADDGTPLWISRYRGLSTPYTNNNPAMGWNVGWDHPMLGCYQWSDGQPLPGGSTTDANIGRVPMYIAPPVYVPPTASSKEQFYLNND